MMNFYTSAHKVGMPRSSPNGILTGLALAGLLGAAAGVNSAHAQSGQAAMTCTNPASGTSWQIHVDYDHRTVDSNPAVISDASIDWQENGWKYTLDRKFGKLTVVVASSTGGNFLYDQCKLEK